MMASRRKGLFGSLTPSGAQVMPQSMQQDMGDFQQSGMTASMPQMHEQEPQSQGLGTKLFGSGWEGKASALGGLLMGDGGSVSRYHQGQKREKAMQQQAAAQEAADMRKRSLDRQDFKYQHDYKAQNAVKRPDAFERALAGAGIDPASEQGKAAYADRVASMARDPNDELVTVSLPGGRVYSGPRSGLHEAMGGGGRPTRPVGGLRPVGGNSASPARQYSQPQMTVTTQELDALVRQYGPNEVQRRVDSGQVAIRN